MGSWSNRPPFACSAIVTTPLRTRLRALRALRARCGRTGLALGTTVRIRLPAGGMGSPTGGGTGPSGSRADSFLRLPLPRHRFGLGLARLGLVFLTDGPGNLGPRGTQARRALAEVVTQRVDLVR